MLHATCRELANYPEVVYEFVPEYSSHHTVTLVSSTDMALWVSEGVCGGDCDAFEDGVQSPGDEHLSIDVVAGHVYYVYVGGLDPGELTIRVRRTVL